MNFVLSVYLGYFQRKIHNNMQLNVEFTDSIAEHVLQQIDDECASLPAIFNIKEKWKLAAYRRLKFKGDWIIYDLCIEPCETNLECLKALIFENKSRQIEINDIDRALYTCCSLSQTPDNYQLCLKMFEMIMSIPELKKKQIDLQQILCFVLSFTKESGKPFVDSLLSSPFFLNNEDFEKRLRLIIEFAGSDRQEMVLKVIADSTWIFKEDDEREKVLSSLEKHGAKTVLEELFNNSHIYGLKPSQIAPYLNND
jgi:hypothetical protein